MKHTPSYYANIPAPVRYCKKLPYAARLLYGEITALCNKEGYCWASNEYFSALYDVKNETVSRWISKLKKQGFINVEINQADTYTRRIYLHTSIQKSQEVLTKKSIALDKKVKCSIYSINNTINTAGSALEFTLKNYSIRFEQEFLMPFEKQFKSQLNFDKFLRDFNNESEMKERAFGSWLIPFLKKYAENWIRTHVSKTDSEVIKLNDPRFKRIG